MADYIERRALLEKAWDADTRCGYVQVVDVGDIESAEAADVAPVVHGRWIYHGEERGYTCSECGSICLLNHESDWFESVWCPHCGARMDGAAHEPR